MWPLARRPPGPARGAGRTHARSGGPYILALALGGWGQASNKPRLSAAMQREAVVYEDEDVRLTPSTSGRARGAFPLFGMVANQENVDPVSGLLTAASRPANSPLTPGAIAAAARAAALLPELPAAGAPSCAAAPRPPHARRSRLPLAGPAAEDPKAGDGSGARPPSSCAATRSRPRRLRASPAADAPPRPPHPPSRPQARRRPSGVCPWPTSRSGWRRCATHSTLCRIKRTAAISSLSLPGPRSLAGAPPLCSPFRTQPEGEKARADAAYAGLGELTRTPARRTLAANAPSPCSLSTRATPRSRPTASPPQARGPGCSRHGQGRGLASLLSPGRRSRLACSRAGAAAEGGAEAALFPVTSLAPAFYAQACQCARCARSPAVVETAPISFVVFFPVAFIHCALRPPATPPSSNPAWPRIVPCVFAALNRQNIYRSK